MSEESPRNLAIEAANRIWPAQFGESHRNIDQRWAYNAGFMAGWLAAKKQADQL